MHRFAIAVLFLPGLWAQETQELSLNQALSQAVLHNPLLEADDARISAAEGLKVQAGLKPNPRIVFQTENTRLWETPGLAYWHDTDTYLYGAAVVERGEKRERRIDVAGAAVLRASQERQLAEAQLRGRVAAAYWNAVAAVNIAHVYGEDVRTFDQIVDFNRNRVNEGATAGVDLLRVEIERDRLSASARRAEQDADLARITLLREMGQNTFPQVRLTTPIDNIPVVAPLEMADVFRARPDVRATEAAVAEQQQYVRLQQAVAVTDPEVQLGYKRTGGFDTVYAAVSIPLAARNRNQGNIAAAEALLRAARNAQTALMAQVRAEVEGARRDLDAKTQALASTVVPLRDRSRRAADISLAAWREGGVDLLRFLDAERTRIEADALYYRSLAEIRQSVVTLRLAEGVDQ